MPYEKRHETEAADAGQEAPTMEAGSQDQSDTGNWGPPYKAIFASKAKGFEMGENRRFKQRVFLFKEKPGPEILAALKENGFTFRPAEQAWTIQANAATRELADRLAREFAGEAQQKTR